MTLPGSTQTTAYRPDIDGLRAIAVLSVVIFHAFPSLARGGFIGVDVFFVISGFLISGIVFRGLAQGNFSFASFYAHRVRRIFPALILMLIVCYGVGWFVLLPDEFSQLGKHVAAGAGFVQNVVLLRETGYFDVDSELKPLLHLWSLAIEEQFYLVYPLVVWVLWRMGLNVLAAIAVFCAISFAINIGRIAVHPAEVFFLAPTRLWELLAGAVLAYVVLYRLVPVRAFQRRWAFHPAIFSSAPPEARQDEAISNVFATMGLALIVAAVFGISRTFPFPGWWAAIPVSGACLLIYAGPQAWVNRTLLANRLMVFVGLVSYPLYLWHWPALSFLKILEESPTNLQRMAAVGLSFMLAWLTYRLVERPLRFGSGGRVKVWILVGFLAAVGIAGMLAHQLDGMPTRYPVEIRSVVNFQYDFRTDARAGKCWITNDNPDAYAAECLGNLTAPHASNRVAIWGDSHAARLYPGLEMLVPGVAQFSRDSCPPAIDFGSPGCARGNKAVLETLVALKPQTVVLFAVWGDYDQRWSKGRASANSLKTTIDRLKAAGIANVVVVGPAPYWKKSLPRLAFRAWLTNRQVPEHMNTGLSPIIAVVDADLAAWVESSGARYFSARAALCSADGCMVRTSDEATSLTTWDYGHLTTAGALVVGKAMRANGVLPSSSDAIRVP